MDRSYGHIMSDLVLWSNIPSKKLLSSVLDFKFPSRTSSAVAIRCQQGKHDPTQVGSLARCFCHEKQGGFALSASTNCKVDSSDS